MMRIWLVFLFLVPIYCGAQDFKKHILYLASDSLHGRAPGTVDEAKAAKYISQYLDKFLRTKTEFQKFYYAKDSVSIDSATNIIARISNKQKRLLVLSAHYDHLGMGSAKSREIIHREGIHHGADDNASGVAMVLELGKWLSSQKKFPYNVVLFFSSGHEDGLYGSRHLIESNAIDTNELAYFINFDMVGRMDVQSKTIRLAGIEKDSLLRVFFEATKTFHVRPDDENIKFTDAGAFLNKGKHTINITTGIHDDYHKRGDVESKINYDGMILIYNRMKEFLSSLLLR